MKKIIIKIEPEEDRKRRKRGIIEIKPKTSSQVLLKRKTEVDQHKHNIRTILYNSNATPIGKYAGIGYQCGFCPQQFAFPAELKTHTLTHHEETISIFMERRPLHAFAVKLDITNLRCNLCQSNIDTLERLVEHLKSNHEKLFYAGLKNYVMPFKFDSDPIKCVLCYNDYSNFKVLLEHMNTHYRNYICEVCDGGFVNKKTLQTHSYRHRTGVFKCSYCSKIFNNSIKKREHEKAVHILLNKRNKCSYCGERFTDYTKKKNHEVKVHGSKAVILKCHACDKTFDNQRSLTVHIKKYHLMERSAPK